jgi:hypothetical protein
MRSHRRRLLVFVLAVTASSVLSGCVERRYTIRTDPPGARVIVNGEDIGTTPVSRSFTFYADRSIRIIKEGYETKDVIEKFRAPWYDNYLTEFFTENLNPYTFRDEVEFNYKLTPAQPAESNGVLSRAEATRAQGQAPPLPRRQGFWTYLGF